MGGGGVDAEKLPTLPFSAYLAKYFAYDNSWDLYHSGCTKLDKDERGKKLCKNYPTASLAGYKECCRPGRFLSE
jgi:hypothetical protein